MAIGPGKYDDALTAALAKADAVAGVLIVMRGALGRGFSCQADIVTLRGLPEVLRTVADTIERDLAKGKL